MEQKKVGVVGATGYAGIELVRLLLTHPQVVLTAVSSVSFEGKPISEVYPSLKNICDLTLVGEDGVIDACDVIFASLPHGLSEPMARKCYDKGKIFIDLGADFRLEDETAYETWYAHTYNDKELHQNSVYALPELFRDQIRGKQILGNPGCYPTSIALGLAPALQNGLIIPESLVIDSKSGATGAGRGLALNTHFTECNEAFSPYKVASHRHTPEIEQTLSKLAGKEVRVTFVPHLLPLNRGIISTMYATLNGEKTLEQVLDIYNEYYKDEKFVRVLEKGAVANLKNVRLSNYCDISLHLDSHTNRLIIVSAIDNMVKGAAGQAIQNMNLVCGFAEDMGLTLIPPAI